MQECWYEHHNDVIWAIKRFKSPATWQIAQELIQDNDKENFKYPY